MRHQKKEEPKSYILLKIGETDDLGIGRSFRGTSGKRLPKFVPSSGPTFEA